VELEANWVGRAVFAAVAEPEAERTLGAMLDVRIAETAVDAVKAWPVCARWLALGKRPQHSHSERRSIAVKLDQNRFTDSEVLHIIDVGGRIKRDRPEMWRSDRPYPFGG
jgi:hypothetical protein